LADVAEDEVKVAVSASLSRSGDPFAEVNVMFTDEETITDLNARYRGVPTATDVLTFDYATPLGRIGEIAVSVPMAQRQATAREASLREECLFLVIHGALHLSGFDDETEEDQAKMVQEMNAVACQVGIPGDERWFSMHYAGATR
jgi:rRNA maturation RNase YbeY